jgi:hypothetical protein
LQISPKKKNTSIGLIIGATAGALLGVGFLVGIVLLWFCRSKRTKAKPRDLDHAEISMQGLSSVSFLSALDVVK